MRQAHTVLYACLLAAWCGAAGAQGFGSVSSRPDAASAPAETPATSTVVEAPATSAAVEASAPSTPAAAPSPPAFSSRPAGENPFLTGSAASSAAATQGTAPTADAPPAAASAAETAPQVATAKTESPNAFTTVGAAAAPPVDASNPFLTGSAAAAAAAASNPFLTGSAARHVASTTGWTVPASTVTAAPATSTASGAGSGPDLATPAQAGTQPFGGNYSDAIAGPAKLPTPADRILVKKSERRLYLLQSGRVIAEYPIKLGLNPTGPKRFEGDFRTPEGRYELVRRNPNSEFFLSLEVSYPNEQDLARARELGLPPGGLIMIHGQPNVPTKPASYYAANDWTNGCIAVSNPDMVDIWMRTDLGTPVEIQP
jgi:hypothetical protein